VPPNYPGRGRRVYPGFLQHTGFVAMNPERHFMSHWDFYQDLVKGDLEDAASHRRFYDEYNAVLDMPAAYYLDTIRVVFQDHLLPRGAWDVAGERVDPSAIEGCALMTIEGELDDISGLGQTRAAHDLCTGVADDRRAHLTVEGASRCIPRCAPSSPRRTWRPGAPRRSVPPGQGPVADRGGAVRSGILGALHQQVLGQQAVAAADGARQVQRREEQQHAAGHHQ